MNRVVFFLFFIFSTLYGYDAPYRLDKFQDILQKSKLQAPLSIYDARWGTKYGEFKYYANQYFYLQDDNYMVFEVCGYKHRSELREKRNWRVSTQKEKILDAEVYFFPLNQEKELTFLQIHSNPKFSEDNRSKINKPLLRVTWYKEHHNLKDHLWAVVRMSANPDEKRYVKIDLGKMKKDFVAIKVVVCSSHLKLFVDNILKVDMDVSYWKYIWNYFKAGVYLQGKGCSKVLFRKLEIE
jgi:hypothetical protein